MPSKRRKKKTFAESLKDFLDETGLKEELKQGAADLIRSAVRQTRESLRGQIPSLPPKPDWLPPEYWPPNVSWEDFDTLKTEDPNEPYAILGVREDADFVVVEAAYRAKVKRAHPDNGGTAEEFQTIHGAFELIKKKRGLG